MQESTNGARPLRCVAGPVQKPSLAKLQATSNAEYEIPEEFPAHVAPSSPGGRLTAQQELVMTKHLSMVRFIAHRIHERLPQHVSYEDLYSAGVLGLVDAVGRFKPSQHVQFRSYAQYRIRGAILDSLRTLDWSPRELRRKGRALDQAIQALTAQFCRLPTDIEVAQKLNISLVAYQQVLGELKGLEIGSLHSEGSADSEDEEPIDRVPGRPEDDPLFRCLDAERRERLIKAIEDLPERERLVMTLYYYEEITMREIGLVLNVGEPRVSQIHASAIVHLRALLPSPAAHQEPPVLYRSECQQGCQRQASQSER
jgi:RNA polymerase sigma factor FliA